MSRVGRLPVPVPDSVTITLAKRQVMVKGPKGELSMAIDRNIEIVLEDKQLVITRKKEIKTVKAMHGTTRNLIRNMIVGVVDGYEKRLELMGTGYRVKQTGRDLELSLGLSHPAIVKAPDGIEFKVEGQNDIIVTGIDKELVGQVAANIRKLRPPEPYKGKGIRYKGEVIQKKAGKAGKGETK